MTFSYLLNMGRACSAAWRFTIGMHVHEAYVVFHSQGHGIPSFIVYIKDVRLSDMHLSIAVIILEQNLLFFVLSQL